MNKMKKRKIGIGVSNGSIDPVLPPLMLVVETNGSWIQTILAFDLTNRSTFLSFAPPLFLFSLLFFSIILTIRERTKTHVPRAHAAARETYTRMHIHTFQFLASLADHFAIYEARAVFASSPPPG